MEVRDDLEVGAASHTGPVRAANEDDFLLLEPRAEQDAERRGRLFVVADGMGGVTGGAEASRTAVRALAASFLEDDELDPRDRMIRGFAAAAREVHRASLASPQLVDMGTTMTALGIRGTDVVVGHIGDSRCLLVRDGELLRLTEDHAVDEPRHLLTRCLGAGRDSEKVDIGSGELRPGDVYCLITDGVWDVVDDGALLQLLRSVPARRAAQAIVDLAIESGTTDNATAVVVKAASASRLGAPRQVEMRSSESALPLSDAELSVHAPRWLWAVVIVSGGIAIAAVARLAGLI